MTRQIWGKNRYMEKSVLISCIIVLSAKWMLENKNIITRKSILQT